MADYRRCYVPGGSFFFTVVTERRAAILGNDRARDLLRAAFRDGRQRWPFRVDALVMLPDHLHAIWTLPPDDADYSKRWGAIKKHFTQSWLAAGGGEQPTTDSRHRYRRRGVWQRRFWEHAIRDQRDFDIHCDYLHYNPVKHGLVARVADWPYSSFHRFVENGAYPLDWAGHPELAANVASFGE
ncbi:MAG: transposase [Candidatus Competibacteraceae bacterium]|nr:transposase [Candidatus Competibacteraceae bacterium]MCP5124657.1 transposase [Gammaproteobacteria bacterium]HRX72343.1 transposase [Candidatus Competibacteraceae bacterium]